MADEELQEQTDLPDFDQMMIGETGLELFRNFLLLEKDLITEKEIGRQSTRKFLSKHDLSSLVASIMTLNEDSVDPKKLKVYVDNKLKNLKKNLLIYPFNIIGTDYFSFSEICHTIMMLDQIDNQVSYVKGVAYFVERTKMLDYRESCLISFFDGIKYLKTNCETPTEFCFFQNLMEDFKNIKHRKRLTKKLAKKES